MVNKGTLRKILFLGEVIVSARVLMFTLPVIMTQSRGLGLSPVRVDDLFLITMTFSALLYIIVGLSGLLGHKLWELLHYHYN